MTHQEVITAVLCIDGPYAGRAYDHQATTVTEHDSFTFTVDETNHQIPPVAYHLLRPDGRTVLRDMRDRALVTCWPHDGYEPARPKAVRQPMVGPRETWPAGVLR